MAASSSQDSPIGSPAFALFAYGFRPFFLAAGAYALLALIAWLWIYTTGVQPLPNQPAQLWHGHEMLYGFVGAAIAGFLLTAVPNWTGTRGFAGTPLILLAALWLTGRLAFAAATVLPLALVAVCELAYTWRPERYGSAHSPSSSWCTRPFFCGLASMGVLDSAERRSYDDTALGGLGQCHPWPMADRVAVALYFGRR